MGQTPLKINKGGPLRSGLILVLVICLNYLMNTVNMAAKNKYKL